jgi:prolyl oligopeptidase
MKKNDHKTTLSVRRSLFAFLFVAAVLAVAAIAPIVSRSRAQSVAPSTASASGVATSKDPKLVYPESKKVDQVDDYFGTKVADPYRWLEDDRTPEVQSWIEAQNKVTFAYLDRIPYRDKLKARLTELYNYPRISAPFHRGDTYFFTKNDGLQNQSVYYIQKGINGKPELFLDPNKFSADGTSVLSTFSLSKDGKYLAYGISTGGSDWTTMSVMEVATRKNLADEIKWIKNSGVSWSGDGFYYSRYPEPEKGKELTSKNEFQTVYFHKVGTPKTKNIRSDSRALAPPKTSATRFSRSPNAAKARKGTRSTTEISNQTSRNSRRSLPTSATTVSM